MPTPNDIANYATAAALTLGVLGAGWKWFFERWIRSYREVPSVEGRIDFERLAFNETGDVVSLDVQWKNTGVNPLHVDCGKSCIRLIPLAENIIPEIRENQIAARQDHVLIFPLKSYASFILEPATNSNIQSTFKLHAGTAHLVYMELHLDAARHKEKGGPIVFTRRRLVSKPTGRG